MLARRSRSRGDLKNARSLRPVVFERCDVGRSEMPEAIAVDRPDLSLERRPPLIRLDTHHEGRKFPIVITPRKLGHYSYYQ